MMVRTLIAIGVGLVLGAAGPWYLFLGVYSLIPWGIAGAVIGYFARSKTEAVVSGGTYGFVLSFAFMIAGYTGSASVFGYLPAFAAFGAFGAACGLLTSLAGFLSVAFECKNSGSRLPY